jgi:hypothetical protein
MTAFAGASYSFASVRPDHGDDVDDEPAPERRRHRQGYENGFGVWVDATPDTPVWSDPDPHYGSWVDSTPDTGTWLDDDYEDDFRERPAEPSDPDTSYDTRDDRPDGR